MKNATLLVLLCFFGIAMPTWAQDTLTVMQYNLLQYGNHNSQYADCYETNNNTQHKDECIRTILNYVKPDIFTVCEFGSKNDLQSGFLRHNLNINGVDYWKTDKLYYSSGSNICNTVFFDSRKIGLKRHVTLNTSPRLTDVYELYMKTKSLLVGDTVKLVCVVAHPKAGMDSESARYTCFSIIMNYIDQHYSNENVLIMGDFNIYRASESGYRLLTRSYGSHEICFLDPLANVGGVGEWNNNSQYAHFHTQSTRSYSYECFSSGGLDDRFDFILMNDRIAFSYNHLRYVQNSYHAVGNDGRHFNMSVDQNGNSVVPLEVAEALFDASDHLPVTMKIAVDMKLGVSENNEPMLQASLAPNPTRGCAKVFFHQPKDGAVQFEVYSLQGQLVATEEAWFVEGEQVFELHLDGLTEGFYLLRVCGASGLSAILKLQILKS